MWCVMRPWQTTDQEQLLGRPSGSRTFSCFWEWSAATGNRGGALPLVWARQRVALLGLLTRGLTALMSG